MLSRRKGVLAAGVVSLAVLLTACASSGTEAEGGSAAATLDVVASTDVYGDIVRQIAGGQANVTSIITDPDADPHSYEASTRNQLALSKADVVIENGGGYDDFVGTMLEASGNSKATVLDVVDISGKKAPAGGELNEHVWYDFPTVAKLTRRIVSALSAGDPAAAATFRAKAATFRQELQRMESTEAAIKRAHSSEGVAITEPVPLYMLRACGLDNKTPKEFSEAIEEGTDVSARVLKRTAQLFGDHQVELLVYNKQTSGPQTEHILRAARSHDAAVVPVTETLPNGKDYLTWMRDNLSAIRSALR